MRGGIPYLFPRVGRLGVIERGGPALRDHRQGRLLAAHALDGDRVQGDLARCADKSPSGVPSPPPLRATSPSARRRSRSRVLRSSTTRILPTRSRFGYSIVESHSKRPLGKHLTGFVDSKQTRACAIDIRTPGGPFARVLCTKISPSMQTLEERPRSKASRPRRQSRAARRSRARAFPARAPRTSTCPPALPVVRAHRLLLHYSVGFVGVFAAR